MFRKPLQKTSQRLLKGSEQRKLVAQLQNQFPLLADAQVEQLCPKGSQITEQRHPDRVCGRYLQAFTVHYLYLVGLRYRCPSLSWTVVVRVGYRPQVCVYLHGSTPLWFTTDEAGAGVRVHPSLYMLHAAPQIMPTITVHDGLAKKLLATDLFMPGIVLNHVCRAPVIAVNLLAFFQRVKRAIHNRRRTKTTHALTG